MKNRIEEPGFYCPKGWSVIHYDKDEKMTFHGWDSYTPQTHVFDEHGDVVFEFTTDDSGSLYINKTKEYFIAPLYGEENRQIKIVRCNRYEVFIYYYTEDIPISMKRFDLDHRNEADQEHWIKEEGFAIKETDKDLKELLNGDETFRYLMLGRLQSDCEYSLAYWNRKTDRLWTHSCDKQIKAMIALYNSFDEDEKPIWCTLNDIKSYKDEMFKD